MFTLKSTCQHQTNLANEEPRGLYFRSKNKVWGCRNNMNIMSCKNEVPNNLNKTKRNSDMTTHWKSSEIKHKIEIKTINKCLFGYPPNFLFFKIENSNKFYIKCRTFFTKCTDALNISFKNFNIWGNFLISQFFKIVFKTGSFYRFLCLI